MRKLFTFILVLVFCFSLAAGVNALSYSDTQDLVDLLKTDGFTISGFGERSFFDVPYTTPYFDSYIDNNYPDEIQFSDLYKFTVTWKPNTITLTDHIYLFVTKANATTVNFYVNGSKVTGNFSGYLNTHNGYYLTFSRQVVREITVEFNTSSSSTKFNNILGVLTAFTDSTITSRIDAGYLSAYQYLYDQYDLDPRSIKADLMHDVPITYNEAYSNAYFEMEHKKDYLSGGTYNQFVLESVRIHLTFDLYDETILNNLDFATLTMMSAGTIPEFHAYVNDSAEEEGTNDVSIECTLFSSDFGEWAVNNQFVDYEAYGETLICDLRGVNVHTHRFLHIELAINPISYSHDINNRLIFYKLLNVNYSYSVSTDLTPAIIISSLNSILDQLGGIRDDLGGITGELGGMSDQLGGIFDQLGGIWYDVNDFARLYDWYSDSFITYFDEILDALQPDQDQEAAVDQQGQQMQQQAGEVGSLNQTLDAVPKQNIDAGDLIGGISTFDGNALTVMQSVTNNKYVIAILTVVFTLALLGYVLFGKR